MATASIFLALTLMYLLFSGNDQQHKQHSRSQNNYRNNDHSRYDSSRQQQSRNVPEFVISEDGRKIWNPYTREWEENYEQTRWTALVFFFFMTLAALWMFNR